MPTTARAIREAAARIKAAATMDDASAAYFDARPVYYAHQDAHGYRSDSQVQVAWRACYTAFAEALDRFASPVEPLVVLA